MIGTFPVTKLNYDIPEKGVHVAKHGAGTPVGTCRLNLWDRSLSKLSALGNADPDQMNKAEKVREWLEEGLKKLIDYAVKEPEAADALTAKLPKDGGIAIELLKNHDYLMDLSGGTVIRCDIDVADEMDGQNMDCIKTLYALGLAYELFSISGDDEKAALKNTLTVYEKLKEEDRDALISILSIPQIDTGNVFLRFLQNSANQPNKEKDRLIAWVRTHSQIDLPYDDTEIIRALKEETDLAELRMKIYNTVNDTYVQSVDTENANRIANMCSENGMRIVAGRFSRALYLDVMLMANSRVIDNKHLQESVLELESLIKSLSLKFSDSPLKGKMPRDFSSIGGEVQTVVNLTSEDEISQAQIEGSLLKLKQALRGFENSCMAKLDTAHKVLDIDGQESILASYRSEIRNKVEQVIRGIAKVEAKYLTVPKKQPVYLIFLQRIHPLDAINLGTLNQLADPFFGEDEEVHELMRGCGHIMYTTANLTGWLRNCDDWIEALPAYAAYEVIPQKTNSGSYIISTFVWRVILEEMYKQNAENWSINIEEVMSLEHLAIAMEMLAKEHGLSDAVSAYATENDVSEEEAIRKVIVRKKLEKEAAELAALIESAYLDMCDQVARSVEASDMSRMEALKQIIEDKGNVIPHPPARIAAVSERGLTRKAKSLIPMVAKPRRDLPNVHVLTTLGPGETENVEDWLEESMALFNVSRAYNLEETSVRKRIEDYQKRIYNLGEKIVIELDLEGDLYNIMHTEGLPNRETGISRLVGTYPEVAAKVAELAVLVENDEKKAGRAFDPDNTEEPKAVLDYIREHPELANEIKDYEDEEEKQGMIVSRARGKVAAALGLTGYARNYLRDHQPERLGSVTARREMIAENNLSKELENPKFRYESQGPLKKYNLLYTPSRVDLGVDEVESVKNVPKWIGGRDRQAANSGKMLYGLYNQAGPTAMPVSRFGEFLKVGENFFSRGGVFYLSLIAGTNLDALHMGDFEFFRDQWNMRGDRIVLPTGETYGGFCVPKEFTLLYSVILAALDPKTSRDLLNEYGIPVEHHKAVLDYLREILKMRSRFDSKMDWEVKATEFLAEKLGELSTLGKAEGGKYVARLSRLATTLEGKGIIAADDEEDVVMGYRFANWVNKKALGLEEINRSGTFRKVHLIYKLVKEARRKNPAVVPDNKLIGMMSAPYKEGGRKEGREVPISDVRFGAGARKLEVYAQTAEGHLLKHIDPEGQEIVKEMFKSFQPPADIRIVGTCTAADLLNHVPASGLEPLAEKINERLMEAGLSKEIIDANCQIYAGDLENWVDIKEMPEAERKALIDEIGGHIHLAVLINRGVFRTYEEALQGVDFIDLGIPDPELLDLVDDLPKLLHLVRKGNPNSAMVFADGTSGARRRTFSFRYSSGKRKVKELFALDDRAVYGSLGLGTSTVETWRLEMTKERQFAKALLNALVSGRYAEAQKAHRNIIEYVRREAKAEEAAHDQIMARKSGVLTPDYGYISESLGKLKGGLPLEQLDFATWLVAGGTYVVHGKLSADEIGKTKAQFEKAIAQLAAQKGKAPVQVNQAKMDRIMDQFARPRYEPEVKAELYEEMETGIAGSLKAAEEKVGRLQKREARRKETARALARTHRREAFEATLKVAKASGLGVEALHDKGMANLGDGKSQVEHENLGNFLAWTRTAMSAVGADVEAEAVSPIFQTMEISDEAYMALAKDLAQQALPAKGNRGTLEKIAMAMEMLDIALVVERTLEADAPEEMMIALARFFDITLNNHIFDYVPYHYHKQRGAGFESMSLEEKMELAVKRHKWLYTFTRHLMSTETEMAEKGPEFVDKWLGDADRGIMGLGVNVDSDVEKFWFSYARLRDAVVLMHDGFALPEIITDVDADALKCSKRANVAIIYPHGNTTVSVALEQGAKLAKEGINLMLCAFPRIEESEKYGRKVLRLPDGFMYIGADDYKAALLSSGVSEPKAAEKARAVDKNGILVAISFKEPLVSHATFFHFTHPMRPYIGAVGAPIIQPIIWEAATHLKCLLPDMLKGSGIRTADQINWFRKQSDALTEEEAKKQIYAELRKFAEKHNRIIAKPEKESGGRMAKILPVKHEGRYLEDNLQELTNVVYTISKVDNAAIQDVLTSYVRRLYSEEFLDDMVDRFARIGVPVLLDRSPKTPLYSYFRQVVALGKSGYEITHHITVLSTRGIANVGQGGILYEYTDNIIDPKYREDMRREITRSALDSMESQRKYIKEHWKEIVEEYLKIHPEFADKVKMSELSTDLTGFSEADIPYEMGDYMPVFLVDDDDNLAYVFDKNTEELVPLFNEDGSPTDVQVYDGKGNPIPRVDEDGSPVAIPMFGAEGKRIKRFDSDGAPISTLLVFKIEPNPGAGLWHPHNEQLPEERKGEGVFKIFKCLGERAEIYRDKLNELAKG